MKKHIKKLHKKIKKTSRATKFFVMVVFVVVVGLVVTQISEQTTAQSLLFNVTSGYDSSKNQTLAEAGTLGLVQSNDNAFLYIQPRSYVVFQFTPNQDPSRTIQSVIMAVEIYGESGSKTGNTVWSVGSSWPSDPVEWGSLNQDPVLVTGGKKYSGQASSSTLWDVTKFVDSTDKLNSMQLKIQNNDRNKKLRVDYLNAQVN
ncbi:hypothetical protein A3F65_03595 [Candidatus Saccharibacteria bacterium RIFCSPHIGHO2_12_FULL_47_16b]|nr:MAG: hypothetical protein A3F65_03595 [Candidatus Saccharibacteria bacterium RIFCSPHIGHO2_12_FULL_47_16b]